MDALLYVTFYFAWFGVIWAATHEPAALALVFPLAQVLLIGGLKGVRAWNWRPWILALVPGLVFDGLLIQRGWLVPETQAHSMWEAPLGIPLWLISMWWLFVMSLPSFRRIFSGRLYLSMPMGALGGVLSYRAGIRWHLLHFTIPWWYVLLGVFWALYFSLNVGWSRTKAPDQTPV